MSSDCFAPAAWRRTASRTLTCGFLRVSPGLLREVLEEPLLAEELLVGVERLGDAVGEEDERLPRRSSRVSAVTGLSGSIPITRPEASMTGGAASRGESRTAGWCPALAQVTRRFGRSKTRHCSVTNMPRGFCSSELVVHLAQDLVGRRALAGHASASASW